MIALDTTTDGGGTTGTSHTFAHTCTGENLILWVAIRKFADDLTSVTYNGVPMNLAVKNQGSDANSDWAYLYYLVNPDVGTHDVVITATSSGLITGMSASYTGASQTSQPDSVTSADTNDINATVECGVTLTVVADGSWGIMFSRKSFTEPIVAGTGSTLRQHNETSVTRALSDSNGPLSAGSQNMRVKHSSGGQQDYFHVAASFSPAPASTRFNIMGTAGM